MRRGLTLVALALAGCRSPTQVTFEVVTDVKCGSHKGTDVSIGHLVEIDGRPVSASRAECDPVTGRVGSIVVIPSGADDEEIAVRFVMGVDKPPSSCVTDQYKGGCIVSLRALRFIPHEPLTVRVAMLDACRDVVCPSGQTCVQGACVGAQISDPEACAGAGCDEGVLISTSDARVDGGGDAGAFVGKRVFVTSAVYTASLGGVAGADAKCNAVAGAVKLPGTYRAWLSDGTSSPSTAFTPGGPYKLVDGTPVANDFATLLKGTLLHAIDMTESGGATPAGSGNYCSGGQQTLGVWTGTQTNGTSDGRDDCAKFTNGSFAYTSQIAFGDPTSTGAAWTNGKCLNAGATYCAYKAPLYCFEQ